MLNRIIKVSCAAFFLTLFVTTSANAQTAFSSAGAVPTDGYYKSLATKNNLAYAANPNKNRIDIMDLANPLLPKLVTSVAVKGMFPESVYIQGNYLYVAEQGQTDLVNGVQNLNGNYLEIFRISTSATRPLIPVSSIASQAAQPNKVYVSGNYAYLLDWAGSTVEVIDISNPAAPIFVSKMAVDSPSDISIKGNNAYITSDLTGNSSLKVFDVTNKTAPIAVSSFGAMGHANNVTIYKNYAYVSGGGPNSSQIKIINITKPARLVLAGTIETYPNSFPFEMTISGTTMFITTINYFNHQLLSYDLSSGPTAPKLIQNYTTSSVAGGVMLRNNILYVSQYGGNNNKIEMFTVTK